MSSVVNIAAARWSRGALDYFDAHAISPRIAAEAGLSEASGGITFPWPGLNDAPSWRRRPLDGRGWQQERGVSHDVWWPLGAPTAGAPGVVLLTEGGPDALAAWTAAVTSTGETAERLADELVAVAAMTAATMPADRVVAALKTTGVEAVVLAFDGDEAGRRATVRIGDALQAAGIRAAALVLPDGDDLADVLARVEDGGWWLTDALIGAAPLHPAEPVVPDAFDGRRYDLAQLVAATDVEPPWRVEPILADGHLTVLSGAGGDGKTFVAMALSGGVAHGSAVAGLRCVPGRAVIFDAENGPYVLGSRLRVLDPGLPADRVAIYDAEGLRLGDARVRARMLQAIRCEGANLAVLDSLRALAPDAKENDSDEMAPLVSGAKALARESGAAILLLVHRGHDDTKDYRGSTAIRDAADMLFVLERVKDDPERRWRRRLRCSKCRIAPEPEERWLGLKTTGGRVRLEEAEPYARADAAQAARRDDDLDEIILTELRERGPGSGNKLAERTQRQKRKVLGRLTALEERGAIRRSGDAWEAVPEGREPVRNRHAAAPGGGGSGKGETPVGGPRPEPPRAETPAAVPPGDPRALAFAEEEVSAS